jgi:endoglucanase
VKTEFSVTLLVRSLQAPASSLGALRSGVVSLLALTVGAAAFGCGSDERDASCEGAACLTPTVPAPGSVPAVPEPGTTPAAPVGTGGPGETPDVDLPLAGEPTEPVPGVAPSGPAGPPVFGDAQAILDASVKFYGAQRSGDGANWLLSGATCHMNDGESITRDLTGGWYDAGDHVKVTLSIAYASYVMLKAYDAFPDAFLDRDGQRYEGTPNGVPDVLDEARYATDYLAKAHLSETELVGMVGNAQQDHRQWVGCAAQEALPANMGGRPRPVSMEANADVAGITAASLALMARLYRSFDPALADSYQTHATQIYQIGKTNPTGSNPGLYGQTGEAWLDEMLAGSAELYRLTSDESYLTDALDFNTRVANHGWAPNYSQSADYSRHSLYVGGAVDAVAEFWRLDVESYQSKVSTNEFTANAVYIDEWGMLRYAAGAAFSAALYSQVTGDTAARDLAISQLNYVAGENSYGRSFVIGVGTNPPVSPHHRNSDTLGVLLTGALVAGPTQRAYMQGTIQVTAPGYEDVTEDYVGNEVALDYNAGLVGLGAFGALQQRAAAAIQ